MLNLIKLKKIYALNWRTGLLVVLLVLFSIFSSYQLALSNFEIIYWLALSFAVIIILYNFEAGIFLLLLSIVVGQILRIPLTSYGGSVITSDIIVFILGFVWLLKKIIYKQRISYPCIILSALLFIFWIIISNLFSLNFFSLNEMLIGSFYFIRWVFYFLIVIIIYNQKIRNNFRKYLNWFIVFAVLEAIIGFIQLIFVPDFSFMKQFGWDPHQGRLLATFFDPNLAGGFFILTFGVCLGIYLNINDKKNKISFGLACLIIFFAIILTFSRSTYLAFLIVFFTITLIKSWRIAIVGMLLMGFALLAVPKSIDRIEGAFAYDKTSQARVESWVEGWEIAKSHPLVGVGFNNLPHIKTSFSVEGDKIDHTAAGIDSSLLTILATTGFVGLILYLIIYLQLVINSFKLSFISKSTWLKGFSLGFGAGLIGLLVHSQFVNSLLFAPILISIWFMAGLIYGAETIENRTERE